VSVADGKIRGLVGSVPSSAPQLMQNRPPSVDGVPQWAQRSVWPSMRSI
jgi:hypothetical protein